jgi:hypothetical protein
MTQQHTHSVAGMTCEHCVMSVRDGGYRLFVRFEAGGRVHTAAFTQEVAR